MPAIFFGHGSPMNAIEQNKFTKTWVEIAKNFPKPKAILAISAHYETDGSKITSSPTQKTIHDFYGFPPELFAVKYETKNDLDLVEKIKKLIPEIESDSNWGLDHGTWSVLKHIYPKADIAVTQLSLDKNKTLRQHYELAKNLKSLRDEGILIIGSGNIVHNLGRIDWSGNKNYDWAIDFNEEIKAALETGDIEKIINYKTLIGAALSVPTTEHFLPLIYFLALKNEDEKLEIFNDEIAMGSISMMGIIAK